MSRKKRPVIAIGIDGDRREYDSVWEAHEDGFHYPKIYRCLKKHGQTHMGYHWRRPAEGKQAEPPNLEEALAWIAHATKVFSELAGGGDDVLTRRGDDFRADIHICRSRILSALISSPGKDGGQEVEADISDRLSTHAEYLEGGGTLMRHTTAALCREAALAIDAREEARAEQWRLRRDAEGSRDAAIAAADSLRIERDALLDTQPASTTLVDTAHDLISDWLQEGVEDLPDDTPVNVNIGGRLIIHNKLGELRSALSASQTTEGR